MLGKKSFQEQVDEINKNYLPQIEESQKELSKLQNWLKDLPPIVQLPKEEKEKVKAQIGLLERQIPELERERRLKITNVFEENSMIAPTLGELGQKRAKKFQLKSLRGRGGHTQASSNDGMANAYHCAGCGWIFGNPKVELKVTHSSEYLESSCLICQRVLGTVYMGPSKSHL